MNPVSLGNSLTHFVVNFVSSYIYSNGMYIHSNFLVFLFEISLRVSQQIKGRDHGPFYPKSCTIRQICFDLFKLCPS